MITTLTLNPALDLFLEVDSFDPDDSNRVTASYREAGGKGVNVSRIIKALGGMTTVLGPLGGYHGDIFKKLLHKENIFIWSFNTDSETRQNITILPAKNHGQTRLNLKGGRISRFGYREMLKLIEQLADNAQIFIISGSLPPGIPESAYQQIIRLIRKVNPACKVFLDADGIPLKKGIQASPYLVKPNIHELERLTGKKLKSNRSIIRETKKLQDKFKIPYMVVSLGSQGVLGFDLLKNKVYQSTPPQVSVATTLGAGDALLAGIAYIFENELNFTKAVQFGMATSSAKVQCHRFSQVTMKEVKKLFKEDES